MTRDIFEQVTRFFDEKYREYYRYWWRESERYSIDRTAYPASSMTGRMLEVLANHSPGRALDLGAGEGADAIRLALLGYEVDAVEGSTVGAEKIEQFSRAQGVRVTVRNEDVRECTFAARYDVIVCNGLLHYIPDKLSVLRKMRQVTAPQGIHFVSLFTDYSETPDCHKVVSIYPDAENGVVTQFYQDWDVIYRWCERRKQEKSHPGFAPHVHSHLKLVAQAPADVPLLTMGPERGMSRREN